MHQPNRSIPSNFPASPASVTMAAMQVLADQQKTAGYIDRLAELIAADMKRIKGPEPWALVGIRSRGDIWKKIKCWLDVALKCAADSNRACSRLTPLSTGGCSALNIRGGLPSFWIQCIPLIFNKTRRSDGKALNQETLAYLRLDLDLRRAVANS